MPNQEKPGVGSAPAGAVQWAAGALAGAAASAATVTAAATEPIRIFLYIALLQSIVGRPHGGASECLSRQRPRRISG
jgi:hypothetical protein